MSVVEAQRLKELEKENGRLKRLLAERMLEVDALKEVLAKKRALPKAAFHQVRNAPARRLPLRARAPTIGCGIPKTRPRNLLVCGRPTSDQSP
jgi:hypothetical protein